MRSRAEIGYAGVAGGLSAVLAFLVLRLWRIDLGVPLEYYGDVNLQHFLVRDVLDHLWYFENSSVGAPHGLELYDYPVLNGDSLNVVLLKVFGLFGAESATAMNLLYVASFPFVGVSAYLALRALGAAPWPAVVCATLYALLPYHFIRGEGHLFLSTYYAVPAGAYVCTATLSGDRVRLWVLIGCAVFVGVASGSFYYAAFTLVLVGFAAVLRYVATGERGAVVAGAAVAGVILAVALVQLAPTLIYRAANGANPEVAKRFTFESEVYSLRLTQLVLPIDGHRIGPLARLKARYTEHFPPIDANAAALGVVGTVGLAWLFAVVVAAAVGRRAPPRHASLGVLAVVAFVIATTGGLGSLVGAVFPQIRAWNRLSVFIAFFALAAVALGLTALRKRVRPVVFAGALVGVLAVGVFDQTSARFVPPYDVVQAEWDLDAAYFSSLESRLPTGASVVQLPYEPFPEPPAGRQAIYEPAKAYLHTDELRWSWGAMRGRPTDWAAANATRPPAELIQAARDAGFTALLVDRLGYGDNGASIERDLRGVLGGDPERSPNGRFLVWRL